MSTILLDTCAVIWTGNNDEMSDQAVAAIDECYDQKTPLFISPFTAWELGLLVSRGKVRLPQAPSEWFKSYMSKSGARLAELLPDVLVAASFLPGTPPSDPADRIIIATAREYGLRIVTRDRRILNYADAGHVQALEC